jgi:AraC-like DNA-binding protein
MSENRQPNPMVRIELPASIFGLADEHESGFFIVPHRHDSAQLIYATEGVMTVETDNGVWVVPPERAVWVPAFVTHSIRMTGAVQLRTLYVDSTIAPIEGRHCCVVQVSQLLRACIARFFDLSESWPEDGPDARVVSVLLDEIRSAPTAPLHLPTPSDPRALRVAEAFLAQPSDRRSIGEWARFAGASERTLERVFVGELGMTLGRWQQQARLLRALEVLASGHSVTEAALEVGFETPSAFIAMFRRAMGTTPARYFRAAPNRPSTDPLGRVAAVSA